MEGVQVNESTKKRGNGTGGGPATAYGDGMLHVRGFGRRIKRQVCVIVNYGARLVSPTLGKVTAAAPAAAGLI